MWGSWTKMRNEGDTDIFLEQQDGTVVKLAPGQHAAYFTYKKAYTEAGWAILHLENAEGFWKAMRIRPAQN